MDYSYYHLGFLAGGEIIEVSLSAAANVCLMSFSDFMRYKMGNSFEYRGGYVTYSPFRIIVPHGGDWYLTVDLGGAYGRVSSSCNVIRPNEFFEEDCNYTWDGKPAKRYPNRKDPEHFTDILYGGSNGNNGNDGHGHIIIENSTGKIVFHRDLTGNIVILDEERCPGINEKKK